VTRASSTDAVPGPAGRASGDRPSGTGPLPGSRSRRRKKGPFRRTGIVLPAIGVAALIVAIVTVASYLMSPNGRGASSLAPVFGALPHSNSIALLEAKRQELIVMNDAAGTLTQAAKPTMVNPSSVMAAAQSNTSSGSQQVSQLAPPDPAAAQQIAYDMLPAFGYNQTTEWTCLLNLWTKESSWLYDAYNPSGAYGIPQALPGYYMASAGADWQTDPTTQIRWGLGYIQSRYGTPCVAWDHEVAHNWY
jgi:hypothetical protein